MPAGIKSICEQIHRAFPCRFTPWVQIVSHIISAVSDSGDFLLVIRFVQCLCLN